MSSELDVRVVRAGEPLVHAAADWIAERLRAAVAERGTASIALAGGSTPQPVHRRLAELDVPWSAVTVCFGDERCVPPTDPESNYGAAREALLDRLAAPGPQVLRMEGEDPDREAAARRYEALLPELLDVLVLGLGADGHTLSLFPGAAALDESERRVVPARGPAPPHERLTLTPPVVRSARAILMLEVGAEKAAATARALQGPWDPRAVPGQLARHGTWIIDPAAAAELAGV